MHLLKAAWKFRFHKHHITEKFGGIDINVEVPSEVNDELTGLALDHSQVVEGMKTEVRQLESLKVGTNMTESEARNS